METFTIKIDPSFPEDNNTEYVFETPGQENINECLDVCRLCLNLVKLQPIKYIKFTKDYNNMHFLEVELGFLLPDEVCESCLGKLNDILLFIKTCKESFHLFTQMQENTILKDTVKEECPQAEEIEFKIETDDHLGLIESITWNKELENEKVPTESIKEKKKCINSKTTKICPKCGESIVTLVSHYKKSWSCKPTNYKCDTCNSYFKTRYYLSVHQKTKHENMVFMCEICSKIMKNPESLQRHIKQHSIGKPFICEHCGKGFSRNEYLTQHTNIHTKTKPYSCKICFSRLTTRSALSVHLKSHMKNQTAHLDPSQARDKVRKRNLKYSDVSCDICNKKFSLPMALKVHMRCHSEDGKKHNDSFFCKICRKTFDNVRLYREHMFSIHTEEGEFTCTHCPKRCISRESLKRHLLTHKEPSIPCTYCKKMFRVNSHLNRHLSLIHNINRGEPFRCKFCEKTFNLKENLTAHERIHTGERPFTCHVCKESFIASNVRKKHVRKVHGEEEVENIGILSSK